LSIDELDWETYEAVEKYAAGNEAGVLRRLLPRRVWKYLFAPTAVNAEAIRRHRTLIEKQYASVRTVYQAADEQLKAKCNVVTEGGNSGEISEYVDECEQQWFPASARSHEECEIHGEYTDEIEEALRREQDAVNTIERLRSKPAAVFLREAERELLAETEQFLTHSVAQGTHQKEGAEQLRASVIETLASKMPEWESEAGRLEEEATPYLELEKYLSEDTLLEDVRSVKERLASARHIKKIDLVVDPVDDRFWQIEERVATLGEELEQSRSQYAQKELKHLKENVRATLNDLKTRLEPSKTEGVAVENPERLLSEIDERRSEIQSFREAPYRTQVAHSRLANFPEYETKLAEHEKFIEEKTAFDKELADHTARYEQLCADAKPYLNYEQYLTRPTRTALSSQITGIETDIEVFGEGVQFTLLSQSDRDRFEELQAHIESVKSHLDDYNPEFVQRQRKACAPLFRDIGPNALDLTEEQEQAVVRNGIYNQVIAAAGTGKTLTLTTRVAYLINEQGIDPDRVLVVTYTNEATEEMRVRLKNHFGITGVEIRTVHSFGRNIIQEAQDQYVDAIDGHEMENFVDRQIREARDAETSEFLDHYYEFLVHFNDVYYDEADFETKEAYVEARAEQQYVTLKGTEVKSRAEKLIADFLYTHRVDYRYEDRATWAESADDKAGYGPDFYLPEYEVYIEHWGIDESGSIAPWFSWSSEEYREKMRWARQQFETVEYELVGTYEFEHDAGRLRDVLRHRLSLLGVEFDRMSFEELINSAFDYNQREGWIKTQFKQFIENAKQFKVRPDEIKQSLSVENPRQYHFGQCGIHLLQQYVLYLTRNGLIDFSDMIHDAVDLIQANPGMYEDKYDHVLVDEFQDIGKGTLELIQELTGPDAAKLFAVGDDWQSIFSFQGAVIEYFTEFADYFEEPVRTDLTANFRSPSQIVAAGNHLISHNTGQLEKTVRATIEQDSVPRVHTLRGYRFYDYVRRVRRYAVDLVQEYCAAGADPADIMVLCRYDQAVPYLWEIKEGLQSQEIPYVGESDQYRGPDGTADDGVSVYSLYQAKGREAEHVILVHAAEGPYGFPPDDRENELLELVQPLSLGGIEEERRAFYVAVTRAEQTLDLLTRGDAESRFLAEIDDFTEMVDTGKVEPLDDLGELMTVKATVDKLLDPWTKQHQRGILADNYGGSARFVSWESADPPTLEKDEWYVLSGVRVGEYKDEKELILSEDSSIKHLATAPKKSDIMDLS
jgi:DNA helicase-4